MNTETTVKHKFLGDSGMTFEEVFDFAFRRLIPVLQGLAEEFGEDHFLEVLRKAASECALRAAQDAARQLPSNDLVAFKAAGGPSPCNAPQILDSVVKQLYGSRKGFTHDQETSHLQS